MHFLVAKPPRLSVTALLLFSTQFHKVSNAVFPDTWRRDYSAICSDLGHYKNAELRSVPAEVDPRLTVESRVYPDVSTECRNSRYIDIIPMRLPHHWSISFLFFCYQSVGVGRFGGRTLGWRVPIDRSGGGFGCIRRCGGPADGRNVLPSALLRLRLRSRISAPLRRLLRRLPPVPRLPPLRRILGLSVDRFLKKKKTRLTEPMTVLRSCSLVGSGVDLFC